MIDCTNTEIISLVIMFGTFIVGCVIAIRVSASIDSVIPFIIIFVITIILAITLGISYVIPCHNQQSIEENQHIELIQKMDCQELQSYNISILTNKTKDYSKVTSLASDLYQVKCLK